MAKTKQAIFVEGKDFQILSRFAHKLGAEKVSGRGGFAVIPIEGFNPQRIKNLKAGMQTTLGSDVKAGAILDRDYRCNAERASITNECSHFCDFVTIHARKEIENFLLVPSAIDRAAARNLADRCKRSGTVELFQFCALTVLEEFAKENEVHIQAQHLANRRRFERSQGSGANEAEYAEVALREFNENWDDDEMRIALLPGKQALSYVNAKLQSQHSVSITPTAIIDAMKRDEIPDEMVKLIEELKKFSS